MPNSQAPQQERSARSFERILDAAERLMARKHFEDISIAEIAAAAGTSVGNFYGRFDSKEMLLDALHERYETERSEAWRRFFGDGALKRMKLKARIRALIGNIIKMFRARTGVFRTFVLRQWRAGAHMNLRSRRRLDRLHEDATELLLGCRGEIAGRDPKRSVSLALVTTLALCRESIVLRDRAMPGSLDLADDDLADELTQMMYSYLTGAQG
jgi:AcrR family transcriptional regulator